MATRYWRAPDGVVDLARDIIESHYPHLEDARILFLFRETAQESCGKVVLGKASLCSAREQAIAREAFAFKIELAWDYWQAADEAFRRALLDHELCHCTVRKDAWAIRSHDIEEFAVIVERHGAWTSDVGAFVGRVQQLELFEEESVQGEASRFVDQMRPKAGSGIDAVEITTNGKGVRLTETTTEVIG